MDIIISKIDRSGNEYMNACIKCLLIYGICNGVKIRLNNDHKKQCWSIYKMIGGIYDSELAKGKNDTLTIKEFEEWLNENGYDKVNRDNLACYRDRKS